MSDEVNLLNDLETRLGNILSEVKEEKSKAFSLSRKKDELEKDIAKLNIIIRKLEEQKEMKEKPSKLLRPIAKKCVKIYAVAFVLLVLFVAIVSGVTVGISLASLHFQNCRFESNPY